MALAHNPQTDAAALVGNNYTVRVLEPSRPAVDEAPFFADDPASPGADAGAVTPTTAGTQSWEELIRDRPDLAGFARTHWLANRGPLPAVPRNYPAARNAFHRLAYSVVAEARRSANGKFGLRYTHRGFGTPFFGDDEQVRVEGAELVHQHGDRVVDTPITTLRAAAEFVGIAPTTEAAEHDSPPLGDLDEPLAVTPEAGEFLGQWYGLAWAVLEELRATPDAFDPERVQLWPGHFDPALAVGNAETNGRATYGMSPGDDAHDEPYVYVGAWGDVDRSDPYWNEQNFNGASLPYSDIVSSPDPYQVVLDFVRAGYDKLNAA